MARILVLDATEIIGEALSEELIEEGFEVLLSSINKLDGDYLLSNKFELLLIEINPSERAAFVLLEKLKTIAPKPKTIVLVSSVDVRGAVELAKLGVDELFSMPFNVSELFSSIKSLLPQGV